MERKDEKLFNFTAADVFSGHFPSLSLSQNKMREKQNDMESKSKLLVAIKCAAVQSDNVNDTEQRAAATQDVNGDGEIRRIIFNEKQIPIYILCDRNIFPSTMLFHLLCEMNPSSRLAGCSSTRENINKACSPGEINIKKSSRVLLLARPLRHIIVKTTIYNIAKNKYKQFFNTLYFSCDEEHD